MCWGDQRADKPWKGEARLKPGQGQAGAGTGRGSSEEGVTLETDRQQNGRLLGGKGILTGPGRVGRVLKAKVKGEGDFWRRERRARRLS